jgi:hypothetical protein
VKPDDTSIPDEEPLYRRVPAIPYVNMVLVDESTGTVTFKRGAFKYDKGDGCSCNRHTVLHEHGLNWQDVKKRAEQGVLRVFVADLRAVKVGIADDPWPDVPEPQPSDVAHALMVAHDLSNSKREQAFSAIASRAVMMPAE